MAVNYDISGTFHPTRRVKTRNNSSLIWITDASDDGTYYGYYYWASPERVGMQHNGRLNALYGDGHVDERSAFTLSTKDYKPIY